MIAKKTKSADLEKKRFAFFQIGLLIIGSVTLVAFEYSSADVAEKVVLLNNEGPSITEDLMTEYEAQPEPERPQVQIQVPIVPDQVIIEDDDVIIDPTDFSLIGDDKFIPETIIKDDDTKIIDEPIVDIPEKEPQFPGGEAEMMKFISSNVVYPEVPREMGEQGIVYVEFVVNTDGSITNVVAKNKINQELMEEAVRVIHSMPNWIPGEQAGKPVRVRYVVPINFVIKKQ